MINCGGNLVKLCYSISVVAGRHSVRIRPVTLMQLAILFPDHEALKEQVDPPSVKSANRKTKGILLYDTPNK